MPDDLDNEEEQEAYRERVGRALARLKETYGSEWIRGTRPKDERALKCMREEVIDIISRWNNRQTSREGGSSGERSRALDSFAPLSAASGDKYNLSGAAALSTELQIGAVSADVAERLHQQAAEIRGGRGSRHPDGAGVAS